MPDVRKDVRLENAIADLDAVYSESENDKQILSEVNNAINSLKQKTDSFYINNTELSDKELDDIQTEYEKLLKACDNYIEQGKNLTDTGFGQGRLICVTAIEEGFFTESQNVITIEDGLANAFETHEKKYGKDSTEAKIAK